MDIQEAYNLVEKKEYTLAKSILIKLKQFSKLSKTRGGYNRLVKNKNR